MTTLRPFTLGSVAATVVLAGCGSSPAVRSGVARSAQRPTGTRAAAVAIRDFSYRPAHLTVAPGARIRFTNRDTTPHTATSTATGGFDTGSIAPGASRMVTLRKPGTYTYFCSFHAFMRAVITVR